MRARDLVPRFSRDAAPELRCAVATRFAGDPLTTRMRAVATRFAGDPLTTRVSISTLQHGSPLWRQAISRAGQPATFDITSRSIAQNMPLLVEHADEGAGPLRDGDQAVLGGQINHPAFFLQDGLELIDSLSRFGCGDFRQVMFRQDAADAMQDLACQLPCRQPC